MRKLVRLAALVALGIWAWRLLLARRQPGERATVAYADGSAIVLESGTVAFERLAEIARPAVR